MTIKWFLTIINVNWATNPLEWNVPHFEQLKGHGVSDIDDFF